MKFSLQTLLGLNPAKRWIRHTRWLAFAAAGLLFSQTAQAQISGTKTVCASGCDYSSITNAVNDLKSKGINGATTISIQKGSYNESVTISGISGLSSTNTLKFVGAGSKIQDVYVYGSTSSSFVFQISSLNYITLENMRIEGMNTANYVTSLYLYYANYCTIKNCQIYGMSNGTYSYNNSVMRMDNSGNNTIEGNELRGGGYMALDMMQSYTYNSNNTFKKNFFKKHYQMAAYIYYGDKNVWTENIVDSSTYTTPYGFYTQMETNSQYIGNRINGQYIGIYSYQGNTGTPQTIHNNIVTSTGTYGYYGIYCYGYGNVDVTNNMILLGSTSAQYGIYFQPYFSSGAVYKAHHNTVHFTGTNGFNIYMYGYYKSQFDIRNNNFTRNGAGTLMYYQNSNTSSPGINANTVIEGNNYYRTGSGNMIYLYMGNTGVYYTSLAAYQTAVQKFGKYSLTDISMPVTYKSATDLHLDENSVAPYGRTISSVTTDIDGDKRSCSLFVSSGADESNYSGNLHLQKPSAPKFTGPTSGIDGVPLSYVNGGTVGPFIYEWYIDGKLQKDSAHLKAAMTTGTHDVKLTAKNCGGDASTTLSVTIKDPASAPTSDFISNVNIINAGDTVKFSDGSSGDPSSWSWSVVPGTYVDNGTSVPSYKIVYGSLTTSDPWIQFLYPGNYKICLTASNKKGSGGAECKSAYIEVKPLYVMGKLAVATDSAATFYDDGGKGDYPKRQGKTTMLIDPCASDVWLTFSMFDMMCNYNYIRVYDGDKEDPTKLLGKCSTVSTYYPPSHGYTGGVTFGTCGTNCRPGLLTDTLHAKSGRMLIVQDINYSYYNYGAGFEAKYWSKAKAMTVPTAKFSGPDSICTNGILSFKNESSGQNVTYLWDLDGDIDAFESNSATSAIWPFYVAGTQTVTLIAKNCGGADTFQKTIRVYDPKKPSTSFVADNTNPTLNDIVYFSTNMTECVDNYKWTFTSASGKGQAVFVNGTKNTSPAPAVTFTDTGCYSVELFTANAAGDDNLKLNCFIRVKNPYCIPSATTMSSDLGISKVKFNTINNSSSQGVTGYSNFAPVQAQSTTVEIGVTYKLTVERTTNKNKATRVVWIDWNGDGDFNDSGEKVGEELNKSTLSWSTDITIPSTAKTGATIMRISVDLGSQTPTSCGTNKFGEIEDYRLYIRPDLTKPVISLVGKDTVVLEQGNTYDDAGATAEDNLDGDISKNIKTTTPNAGFNMIPGTYTYRYNVTDASQNEAITVRRIVIITPDVTAPELVVMKPDSMQLQVFAPFTAPAVLKADDLVDGDLKGLVKITSNVNNSVLGYYTVNYTITDASKNTTTVVRYVRVIDTIIPTMALVGNATETHEVGNAYTDQGVTVSDNYTSESELRSNLVVQSTVDANTVGTYTVIYVLTDPNTGRKITLTRTVEVKDTQNPVASLNGNPEDVMDVFTFYDDKGVTATDNYDDKLQISKSGSFYTSFPNGKATALGKYTIVYVITDQSGNTVTVSRDVTVVDRVAPTGSLIGSGYVSVCRWSDYKDEGVNATDNYDKTSDLTITQEGTFFFTQTNVEGIYNLRYKIVDKSGNVSYTDYRYIMVRNPYEAPCLTQTSVGEQIGLEKLVKVYPNPNTGKFTVEANIPANEQVRISVTNLLGQEVAVISNGSLNMNTFQVDLSNQKAGVYMLNIKTNDQSATKRIVITK